MGTSKWIFAAGLLAGGAFVALAAPAAAQLSPQGTGNCRVGLTVTDRAGKTGKVETATGNSCWVRFADGTKDYYQQWMLKASGGGAGGGSAAATRGRSAAAPTAGGSAGGGGGAAPSGAYHCTSPTSGNMRLTFRGKGQYANEQGKAGTYTISGSGAIAFTSGPWAGFYGQVLPDGKVGLSSKPNGRPYYMVCERH